MNKKKFQKGFLIVAIAFVAIGINNGEMENIFRKAIIICLECIGLG